MESKTKERLINLRSIHLFWISTVYIGVSAFIMMSGYSAWFKTPFVVFSLTFFLGFLIFINLKIKSGNKVDTFLYSVGLGISFLMLGGLGINWLLPYIGVSKPLASLPLTIFFGLTMLMFSYRAYYFNRSFVFTYKLSFPKLSELVFGIIPLFFVIQSIVGVSILNNMGSGVVTLSMLAFIAVYSLVLMLWNRELPDWVYISAIYLTSLSLLLMYSMRSGHIVGWDIHEEYQVFQKTLENLRWKMSYYPGLDYNSCLSITILPTIFKVLTGIPAEYVFKFLFQMIFALTPVTVYAMGKRYLANKFAFMSAFLLLSQVWFFEQMPALVRQEVAFVFYGLVLMVFFDKYLKKSIKYFLFCLFTLSLVVSHYSTSYILLALMLGTSFVLFLVIHLVEKEKFKVTSLKPAFIVIPILFIVLWQVFVTGTGSAVSSFVSVDELGRVSTTTGSLANTQNGQTSRNLISARTSDILHKVSFNGNHSDLEKNLLSAYAYTVDEYIIKDGKYTYYNQEALNFTPKALDDRVYKDTVVPEVLSSVFNRFVQFIRLLFINIFTIIGILTMYLFARRKKEIENYEFIIFGTLGFGLIALMIVIPYLQVHYNLTRLYLQVLMSLAVLSIVGGVYVTKYLPKYQVFILGSLLTVIFISQSGFAGQFMGGQKRITFDQRPATDDHYIVYDGEAAGARWLSANRYYDFPIQSDSMANLRLQSFGNLNADNSRIFPLTLFRDGYVYMINMNLTKGHTYYLYRNNNLIYEYPIDFINKNKDLIYTNKSSRIYR